MLPIIETPFSKEDIKVLGSDPLIRSPSAFRVIRDERSAETSMSRSPEVLAARSARPSGESQATAELTLPENVPHPDRTFRDSRRFVFPAPFGPRMRFKPGPQSVRRTDPRFRYPLRTVL